jgi:hypothetical protein
LSDDIIAVIFGVVDDVEDFEAGAESEVILIDFSEIQFLRVLSEGCRLLAFWNPWSVLRGITKQLSLFSAMNR